MTNPGALILEQPLEIDDARKASRKLADQRRTAELEHERLTKEAAEKERLYRLAFSKAFVAAEGTAAEREAVAKAASAQENFERDLADRMVKVMVERLRGLEGERSQLKSLIEWSAQLRLDGRER